MTDVGVDATGTLYPTVTLKTFFGDYLNGLWLTWTSKPTDNTGTSELTIDFQANFRSRLHVFCYGCGYADDAAATNLIKPTWNDA